jgi:hypothetical protein
MQRYIEQGVAPGSFLSAILCNDFMAAAGRADDINQRALFAYCYFLYNEAPAGCHSSESNFKHWLEIGGLRGITAAAAATTPDGATAGQRDDASANPPPADPAHPGSSSNVVSMFDAVLRPAVDTGD